MKQSSVVPYIAYMEWLGRATFGSAFAWQGPDGGREHAGQKLEQRMFEFVIVMYKKTASLFLLDTAW